MESNTRNLTFGFDIGIASVGWAVLGPERILNLGVRAFDKAENEKGEPLNLARRLARTQRTRLSRRVARLKKLRRLLRDHGLVATANASEFVTPPRSRTDWPNDPWFLRARGLDAKLEPGEWARVLYHLVKHRGFYSARKSETADEKSEGGKLLKGVRGTANLRAEKNYRTLGELLAKDETFKSAKRNKAGSYANSLSRHELGEELRLLFEQQRALGNPHASEALQTQVIELFEFQKPALTGEAMLRLIGKCTFEKDEYRAPKCAYSAERFIWLTKLNNLRVKFNGEERPLTWAERQAVLSMPYKLSKVSYKQLRKELEKQTGFPAEASFSGVTYTRRDKKEPEDATLVELKAWHELRKAFEKAGLESSWQRISSEPQAMDAVAEVLSIYKTDDEIRPALIALGLSVKESESLLEVDFKYFLKLSLKAVRNILPYMEQGKRYDEACALAGYNHSQPDTPGNRRFLPPISKQEVRNPVVYRALNQARKVLNALIREYGPPTAIHVELARDLSRSWEERMDIKKGQDAFREEKEKIVEFFKETFSGHTPKGKDLAKLRLYREQDGQCAYSQKPIDLHRLLEEHYVEIDHILPYSRSFDDSQANKALVLWEENQNKGNRTPFEYFGNDEPRWREFEAWVRGHKNLRRAKRERLLRRHFDEKEAEEFASRNLNDTRYITSFFQNHIKKYLTFAPGASATPVLCPAGGFTSFIRTRWGLSKNREASDLHHALDACVIAAASRSLQKRVSDFSRRDELAQLPDGTFADKRTGEILSAEEAAKLGEKFPQPWSHFREEVMARLSPNPREQLAERFPAYDEAALNSVKPVIVSRAPKRRNRGALHQETIRSAKQLAQSQSAVRVKLADLKLTDLENIVGANDPRNAGLMNILRERLEQHPKEGKKAFAAPVYKPLADGSPGPLVRTVKLLSTQKGGVPIRGGIADQASMWRVDVFEKGGKFYLVPIYQSDRRPGADLPNRASTANTPRDQWTEIDETFLFKFSLSANDLLRLRNKDREYFGYFAGLGVSTASISIKSHDNNEQIATGKSWQGVWVNLGVKVGISAFEKLHINVLGNIFPAKPETRGDLA
ncbi:MAG: type II CRISPR RNA-guided endonuclease Cas9 [Thiobacillus sp.]